MPASTKCFKGIATSVVSKSLSGSGIITCFVIASCPPVARSPGRCFLTEYQLAQHHKYTTLDFRRALPTRAPSHAASPKKPTRERGKGLLFLAPQVARETHK